MNCAKRKTHEGYKDDEYICDVWTINDVFDMAEMNHPDVKLSIHTLHVLFSIPSSVT